MKSGKLAKRKKNYNLVQVCCCWCGALAARYIPEALETVIFCLQEAVAKWEVARRRDVSSEQRAELVTQLLQQVTCSAFGHTPGLHFIKALGLTRGEPAGAGTPGRAGRIAHWLAHIAGLLEVWKQGAAARHAEGAGARVPGAGKEPVRALCGDQARKHSLGCGACRCGSL